jgi:3-hydroxy-9,10-secoandrosta-1,3,5(10)-triene-9,17-dione monooxygenase
MIVRARSLAPGIRARAAEAERTRRLPEATLRELHESGLLRALQPKRVGGAELDYGLLVEIGAIFGAACASTAWVWGNLASHHWMLAMWPARAQDEIWGADPNAVIGSAFVFPSGRAREVAGGYQLSGRWPFSSGIVHSSWVMVGALVAAPEGQAPEMRMFLIPPGSFQIIDTWHVSGLCATGSHDIACENLLVAEDFTLSVEDTKRATAPGLTLNPGPLYRIPVFAAFSYIISGALLGIAEGAVEHYVTEAKKRASSYTGERIAELAPVQIKISQASAACDAARLLMIEDCKDLAAQAEAGETPDELTRARYRRNSAFAAKLCLEAVDLMVMASGGGGIYDTNPIQRAFRDAHAAASHISLTWDAAGTIYGRVALGLPSGNATL